MFHLYITLAFIIPNIYMFFRIRGLFISKGHRFRYTLVYLLTAAIYPLTERYSEGDNNLFMQILSSVSGYILPFFLYLFLAVLLFDLFLLLNLRAKILLPESRKSFAFRCYTLSAMIIFSVTIVVSGAINLNTIHVSKYSVEVPRRHAKTDHLRVAFVADFHIQQNTRLRYVDQFVRKVNALQPDIMLYGGDMVEGDSENETTEAIESVMKTIHAKYGSFGVTGNHEFYGGQEQGSFFRKAGITLLGDTVVKIDSSFYLAGRYDQHFGQRKTVNEIMRSVSPDLPVILMDHRPTELQEVSHTAADVQFSGHTHNGQLFPINLITRNIYEIPISL
jgi:predicted MPP superfamily phosphohydrolase